MANLEDHAILGALVSIGTYCAAKRARNEQPDFPQIASCGVVGALVATLPDVLEPPSNPRHRSLAHSLSVGGTIAIAMKKTWDNSNFDSEQKAKASAITAAYLSHLVLDSLTPAGLPLLRR